MTMVGPTVHCFSCTCRACGQEVSTLDVECHACHFRVCPGCTTDGICTSCVWRCRPSNPPSPKKRQFKREWLLTRSWLRYEATTDKMWCIACQQHPQLGHSVPFVQGTSNFMLCSLKYHQRSGSHVVSLALWQSGGRVTSVIQTLPCHVLQGIYSVPCTGLRTALVPSVIWKGMPSSCHSMEAQLFQVIVHPPRVGRCFALFPNHFAFPRV